MNNKHIHFIAIGGAAMSNLAICLKKLGHTITGSDDEIFDPARTNLNKYGLLPEKQGWFPEKISSSIDAVIIGMHARADNPELIKAKELGLKIFSFPEFIYENSKNKIRIVVGGSHGKTTITAMIMHVLKQKNIEADYLAGAAIPGFELSVGISENSKYIVIEGDEYLTSPLDLRPKFHLYKPHIAVLSGIAFDHSNVFKTFENYVEQFRIFIELIEPNGKLIYCNADNTLVKLVQNARLDIEKLPYELPEYQIINGKTCVVIDENLFGLEVFGEHNLLNAQAAQLVCEQIGIDKKEFWRLISSFKGAYNRLTKIYESEKLIVYRDFAHSPSKVKATINAVRQQYPDYNLIACLELHTYSSLSKEFLPNYANSMDNCNLPIVYFNPHTIEMKKLEMLDREIITKSFNNPDLNVFQNIEEMKNYIFQNIKNGRNVLLLMSSGNFNNMNINEFFVF